MFDSYNHTVETAVKVLVVV